MERVTQPLGHSSCKAIKELARTSIASTELLDVDESFKLNLNQGGVPKTRRRAADPARVLTSKQVARAKLDLNKTRLFLVAAKEYMKVEGRPPGVGVILQP